MKYLVIIGVLCASIFQTVHADPISFEIDLSYEQTKELQDALEPFCFFRFRSSCPHSRFTYPLPSRAREHRSYENISMLCDCIAQKKVTAPKRLVVSAVCEAAEFLMTVDSLPESEIIRLAENLEEYFKKLMAGSCDIVIEDSEQHQNIQKIICAKPIAF